MLGDLERYEALRLKNEFFMLWISDGRSCSFPGTVPTVPLTASDERVLKLWENTNYFKTEMKRLGFDTGISQTPITPVMLGEAKTAQAFSKRLFEQNIFAMSIGFPTVAKGKARIRVMISATHSKEDLDIALTAFAQTGKELGVI